MVESSAGRILGETVGCRRIGLGVTIDEERGLFSGSEASGQIHRGCSLSNSPLLVCNRDYSSQSFPRQRKSSKANGLLQAVSRETLLFRWKSDPTTAQCSMWNNLEWSTRSGDDLVPRGTITIRSYTLTLHIFHSNQARDHVSRGTSLMGMESARACRARVKMQAIFSISRRMTKVLWIQVEVPTFSPSLCLRGADATESWELGSAPASPNRGFSVSLGGHEPRSRG